MNRREMLKTSGAFLVASAATGAFAASPTAASGPASAGGRVERWDAFEITLNGPKAGNPFIDHWLKGTFRKGARAVTVDGFYDGDGVYKIRFMPDSLGPWTYTTDSNVPALKGQTGAFETIAPSTGNHGPVRVRDVFHFGYEDGTPYFPFGTTCYAWAFQTQELQEQTLATLKTAPFNKLRMCIFPKWYHYNHNEPPAYPFPRAGGQNDYSQFNPEYFRHLERRVLDLRALAIEADLILFHPYDHWGYQDMPAAVDDRYLRYVIARFGAFRNVWWSLANEYNLMRRKTPADWDRYAEIVTENDPYSHLRSIHYSRAPYDYTRVWCTHATMQTSPLEKAAEYRTTYNKPVIFDEMLYEGNINSHFGSISAEEMTRRFWACIIAGTYGGHGETYVTPDEIEDDHALLWWSHGGVLKGTSPQRIAFLRKVVEETAAAGGGWIGYEPIARAYYPGARRNRDESQLYYLDFHQPLYNEFALPESGKYQANLIDPWAMTITPVPGEFTGKSRVLLTGRPYMAVLFTRKA